MLGRRLHQFAFDFYVVTRHIFDKLEKLVKGTESRAAGQQKNLWIPTIIRYIFVQNLILNKT
jgi:hypothetical protein